MLLILLNVVSPQHIKHPDQCDTKFGVKLTITITHDLFDKLIQIFYISVFPKAQKANILQIKSSFCGKMCQWLNVIFQHEWKHYLIEMLMKMTKYSPAVNLNEYKLDRFDPKVPHQDIAPKNTNNPGKFKLEINRFYETHKTLFIYI